MRKNNPYGYKIGYRENGSLLFNRLFITRNYNHAVSMRNFYRRYIKQERDTKRPLINPFWEILPILGNPAHYEKGNPCRNMGRAALLTYFLQNISLINFLFGVAIVA